MKKTFVMPEMDVQNFVIDDVVTTSGKDNWDVGDF